MKLTIATLATLHEEQLALLQQRIEIHKQLESDAHELQQVSNSCFAMQG